MSTGIVTVQSCLGDHIVKISYMQPPVIDKRHYMVANDLVLCLLQISLCSLIFKCRNVSTDRHIQTVQTVQTVVCTFMLYLPLRWEVITLPAASQLPLNPRIEDGDTQLFHFILPSGTIAGCYSFPPGKACPYQFLISIFFTCPKLQWLVPSSPCQTSLTTCSGHRPQLFPRPHMVV